MTFMLLGLQEFIARLDASVDITSNHNCERTLRVYGERLASEEYRILASDLVMFNVSFYFQIPNIALLRF